MHAYETSQQILYLLSQSFVIANGASTALKQEESLPSHKRFCVGRTQGDSSQGFLVLQCTPSFRLQSVISLLLFVFFSLSEPFLVL